ncbi:MAG: YtxH domain-containing protein [Candidatus Saccharimonadales bacterium]
MSKIVKVIGAAAAGFVAGILLAPKSGKETRADIKEKAVDAKHYAGEKAEHIKGAVADGVESLKQGAGKVGDEAKNFAKSAKKSASVVGKEAGKLSDEAKTRASRLADEAKNHTK